MQVEPDYIGVRNGPYSHSPWAYRNDNTSQNNNEADLLPEKIYSMVSKLVDEDNDVDDNQIMTSFQAKKNNTTGFYDGTHTWCHVPNHNKQLNFQSASPPPLSMSNNMLYTGLGKLDITQNLLDLSLLTSVDGFSMPTGKLGENLDSGFASPAEKSGCMTSTMFGAQDDLSALANWDWGELSSSLDPDANHNYINLLSQNPDLLDQIVRGDSSIDGILNDSGLMQLDFLEPTEHRQPPYMMPISSQAKHSEGLGMDLFPLHNAPSSPPDCSNPVSLPTSQPTRNNDHLIKPSILHKPVSAFRHSPINNDVEHMNHLANGSRPVRGNTPQCSSMHGLSAPNMEHAFSPFRPPPELPFGFTNNEFRPHVPEQPRNGFNMHLPNGESSPLFNHGDYEKRSLVGEWPVKQVNPYGNGLVGMPRFSPSGPFRSPPPPPPFLPPPARHPMYPPHMDPAELYPLPCFPRHPLFQFPQPIYNYRQIRRNPIRDELSARLDQCYEQFRQLEKERKKTEAELARHNPGKKLSSANSMTVPRLPPSPTRVDRLVVDELREHARVVTLVTKMERLRGNPVGSDVHTAMIAWDEAIRKVQALRQEEVRCRSRIALEPPEQRALQEDNGIRALAAGIHQLSMTSRHARTALWSCLMVTLEAPSANLVAAPTSTASQ